MRRAFALMLAMTALLAHGIAIHVDGGGGIGPPRDGAYVAYRIAANWVQFGDLAWNLGRDHGLEIHASAGLIWIAALFERAHLPFLPVTLGVQLLGAIAALATLGITSRFSNDRTAGIIPPALLVANGTLAEAAFSGTEWPLFTMALALTWVAIERRHARTTALGGALLVALRPEGLLLLVAMASLSLVQRKRRGSMGPAVVPLWSFLPGLLAALLLATHQSMDGASTYLEWWKESLTPHPSRWTGGLGSLRDAAASWATPLLLPFPLAALAFRKLSGTGARALALASLWCALSVNGGGSDPALHIALAPALPLLCVGLQQGILTALDTENRWMEGLAWLTLTAVAAVGTIASRFPEDLGRLRLRSAQMEWLEPRGPVPVGATLHRLDLEDPNSPRIPQQGRLALQEELDLVTSMHSLGVFLRDHGPRGLSLATVWPGVVGYLNVLDPSSQFEDEDGQRAAVPGLRMLDLSGRHGSREEGSLFGVGGRLPLSLLEADPPDLLQPGPVVPDAASPPHPDLDQAWGRWFRLRGEQEEGRRADTTDEVAARWDQLLQRYEWICVPVQSGTGQLRPVHLLRHVPRFGDERAILRRPQPSITVDRDSRRVRVGVVPTETAGLPQVVNLRVDLVVRGVEGRRPLGPLPPVGERPTLDGVAQWIDPFGVSRDRPTFARVGVVLAMRPNQGEALLEFDLPPWFELGRGDEVVARLLNYGVPGERALASISRAVWSARRGSIEDVSEEE